MEDIEEGPGQFVISGGNGPTDLQVSDHPLDAIAFAIDASAPTNLGFAIGFGRDAGAKARGLRPARIASLS